MLNHQIIAASAAFIVAASSLSAQGKSWGPVVGLSQTTLSGVIAPEYRLGYAVGAQYHSEVPDGKSYWQTGLGYSVRGATLRGLGPTGKMILRYVDVPVFGGWNISIENPWVTPFVTLGGQVNIKISCRVSGGPADSSKTKDCDDPSFGKIKMAAWDLTFGAGGGAVVDWSGHKLQFDLKYLLGLRAITANTTTKNKGFVLAFSYLIPIGSRE